MSKIRYDNVMIILVYQKVGKASGVGQSVWQQLTNVIMSMFYIDETNNQEHTDCSSCQSLAPDGHRVRYM